MSVASSSPPLNSKALQANLQETAGEVHIDARFTPLQEIVSRQQGLSSKIHSLLHEVSHPYHNWKLIIPELRSYVLKNINIYRDHELGPQSFSLFIDIFFEALIESAKNEQLYTKGV